MSRLTVRQAQTGDAASVVQLERGVVEAPHWPEPEYMRLLERHDAEGGVRHCFLVAELEGKLVGFAVGKAVVRQGGGFAELESVAVAGTSRRLGVGKALCGAIVAWSRELGAREVDLEVRTGSAGAIALYRGLGFVGVGQRREYYREPVEDALLMRLDLGAGASSPLPLTADLW